MASRKPRQLGQVSSVRIEGMAKLNANLRRLDKATRGQALDRALLAGAEPVRKEASRLARRSDTPSGTTGKGHAADHIEKVTMPRADRDREVHVGPEEDFWYLVFDEFGTPHQSAGAPFRTAADTRFKEAVREFRDELRTQIKRAIR